MRCSIDVKPIKYTARTKDELMSMITGDCDFVYDVKHRAYRKVTVTRNRRQYGDLVLVNLVKHRRKSKITNNGRVCVREARWDAYVYIIPVHLVESAEQNARNFKMVPKVFTIQDDLRALSDYDHFFTRVTADIAFAKSQTLNRGTPGANAAHEKLIQIFEECLAAAKGAAEISKHLTNALADENKKMAA